MDRDKALFASLLALCLFAGGCITQQDFDAARKDAQTARDDARRAAEARDGMQNVVIAQQKQIETLQGFGQGRLDKMFRVQRIEIGQYTGGVTTSGKGYDEGIKVYMRPIDQDGSVLKTAGDVTIRLFDLANPPDQTQIGEYKIPVTELGKHWYGGFVTYHFSFVCPWQKNPAHPDITVRAEFTEYLTGQTFADQTIAHIKMPPPGTPTVTTLPVSEPPPGSTTKPATATMPK